jgi:UDP-2,3-diacylglucosamine pyrophosphatase LpxH
LSALRYVCLSDLHLGADYSVLTHMNDDGKISLLEPSATLAALGPALREHVRALSGPELPSLVLMGDVLDLGLSRTGAVAQAFKRFIEALFPAGVPPAFSPRVLCVPGNHDHHLWRSAQDQYFLDHLGENTHQKHFADSPDTKGIKDFIPDLLEHTHLFAPQDVKCGLMAQLMRGYPHLQDAEVDVAYPNLGLIDEVQKRCVILHHGHYLDSIYRAMSTLNVKLRGEHAQPRTVAQIEGQNGSWVDFLWSDLGSGGDIAADVATLYETMRSALASRNFAQRLSDDLLAGLSAGLGLGAGTEVTHGITISNIVRGLVDLNLLRGAESERNSYVSVMSAGGVADLRWYLGGPVRDQIARAGKLSHCQDMSFVFGHTHKPFQDEISVAGYERPIAVYNTGGWVMDQPTMAPAQGAAAVFIDDQMNVASLRLFNDPLNGLCPPVRAVGAGGNREGDNVLLARMKEVLRGSAAPWQVFSDAATTELKMHGQVLLKDAYVRELQS